MFAVEKDGIATPNVYEGVGAGETFVTFNTGLASTSKVNLPVPVCDCESVTNTINWVPGAATVAVVVPIRSPVAESIDNPEGSAGDDGPSEYDRVPVPPVAVTVFLASATAYCVFVYNFMSVVLSVTVGFGSVGGETPALIINVAVAVVP